MRLIKIGSRQNLFKSTNNIVLLPFLYIIYMKPVLCNETLVLCPYALGDAGRAEGPRRVLRLEGAKEGRGTDGRRCGVHNGGEESASVSLGKPLPHTPLLHHPDQGAVTVLG